MKQLSEYRALIVDLDGTLYFQKPVRMAMLKDMLLHFWRVREFLIVRKYRKLYEQGCEETERLARLPAAALSAVPATAERKRRNCPSCIYSVTGSCRNRSMNGRKRRTGWIIF